MTNFQTTEFSSDYADRFKRIDTSSWEVLGTEPAGAEIKHVLADPINPSKRWFFKNNSIDENMRYGEDYAELIASNLAPILGVSCAKVHLASHMGIEGIISLDVAPRGLELVHGAVWLPTHGIADFVRGDKFRRGHSLANIKLSLIGVAPPPGSDYPPDMTAFDAFAGVCIFDAWISNQDRHEDNWAVLRPMIRKVGLHEQLSPIYDNGSSLAFNVSDDSMKAMLESSALRIEKWSARGKAKRFERVGTNNRRLGLAESAAMALSMCTDVGNDYWRSRLKQIDLDRARRVAHHIPKMSDSRSRFIDKLLVLNMERIRDVCLSAT